MIEYVNSAEKRFEDKFIYPDELNTILNEILEGDLLNPNSEESNVLKTGFILRSYNIYKCILQLCKVDHWEQALILLRSIFELLLNCEYIFQNDDTEIISKNVTNYIKFNYLQKIIAKENLLKYDEWRGRKLNDNEKEKLNHVQDYIKTNFSIFFDKNGKYVKYWNRKNVSEMAKMSKNSSRYIQYEVIYSLMSAYSHGTPLSTLSTFNNIEQTAIIDNNEEMLILNLSFLLTWIGELLFICQDSIDQRQMNKIFDFYKRYKKYTETIYNSD